MVTKLLKKNQNHGYKKISKSVPLWLRMLKSLLKIVAMVTKKMLKSLLKIVAMVTENVKIVAMVTKIC